MKNKDILSLLTVLAAPVALILVGLVLTFVPDTGSILLSRLLGAILNLAGIAVLLWAIFTRRWSRLLLWLILVSTGSFLLTNPLALAAFTGRILGVLIALRSGRDFFRSVTRQGKLLSGVLTLVGIVLIFMPMGASRLVFSGCGVVLLLCGGGMLLERLREMRCLPGGRDDIIDAL